MRRETKKFLRLLALIGLLPLLVCFLALSYFVWLPDLSGRTSLVCEWGSSKTQRITVLQIWGTDGYMTIALLEDGESLTSWVLDGDDKKQWRGNLSSAPDGSVELTLSGDREGTFYLSEPHYRRTDGIIHQPWTKTREKWSQVEKEYGIARK